jgi:hypothetical protein
MKLFVTLLLFIAANFFAPATTRLQAADNIQSTLHISEQRAPIEPTKIKKWFAKSAKKQSVKQSPNKSKKDRSDLVLSILFAFGVLAMVGLPLGVGLLLPWLWITSAAILGGLLIFFLILILSINAEKEPLNNAQRNMSGLALAILWIFGGIYLGLLLIDVMITGIVAGILWLWLAPLIALVLGILVFIYFSSK